jgi:hypothetical protein
MILTRKQSRSVPSIAPDAATAIRRSITLQHYRKSNRCATGHPGAVIRPLRPVAEPKPGPDSRAALLRWVQTGPSVHAVPRARRRLYRAKDSGGRGEMPARKLETRRAVRRKDLERSAFRAEVRRIVLEGRQLEKGRERVAAITAAVGRNQPRDRTGFHRGTPQSYTGLRAESLIPRHPPAFGIAVGGTPPDRVKAMEPGAFVTAFAQAMQANPPHPADAPIVCYLARIGIVPGEHFDGSKLTSEQV